MITEEQLATTSISTTFEIEPSRHIIGDLSGLIAEFCESLVGAFYTRTVARKANVVVSELFTNAVIHNSDGDARVRVSVGLDGSELHVTVCNAATEEQIRSVTSLIQGIANSGDARSILARTIRERRADGKRGGLGLIRLIAENKFSLSASRDGKSLCVQARFAVKGAQ